MAIEVMLKIQSPMHYSKVNFGYSKLDAKQSKVSFLSSHSRT